MKATPKGTKWVLAALVGVVSAGCGPPAEETADAGPAKRIARLNDQIEDLRLRVQELQDRTSIQADRIEELKARNERLASLVRDLQFDNRLLERHVEALAPAPKERDYYKAECERLRSENEELRRRLERLGREPASGPTTRSRR